ncbi:phage Gp37/Gp68 family protein [Thermoanaerobacterium thermosaccharolyticum]|uniref:phage Gp37/Gp68 family protein n=1 Tax=Thermoanaerobacterium TaxID=28895 RepID=UPI0026E0978C|nr:phage Gp37/Gp68 family protein [Thermoanaerobacterium sp. CMT5567-10]WKV08178.1 phage Gp37/Gp68 family protein [Thermoanaerobacterium sp. CMT5567-10]
MNKTKIEWTDTVWNPVTGCTPISEGCQNCYANRIANRLKGRCGYPADEPFKVTLHPERLNEPLQWRKPQRIFVCSMGDLFHEDVHPYDIMRIFNVMAKAKHHTFLVLTKRPERMLEVYKRLRPGNTIPGPYFSITGKGEGWAGYPPTLPDNIWLGVTAENQQRADERIPILLQIPAAVHFVSVEPMLGPVKIDHYFPEYDYRPTYKYWQAAFPEQGNKPILVCPGIDWVICGGESGLGARPMHPDWARDLRDQCQKARIPFFFKSWGEYKPLPFRSTGDGLHTLQEYPECKYDFVKVGKKTAGRVLDGKTWNEIPSIDI